MSEVIVDARHLLCPIPVIKTQQAVDRLVTGDTVKILCTDPGVEYDIPAWVRVHGHQILSSNLAQRVPEDDIEFLIRVRAQVSG